MQVFNEINSRKCNEELNVFEHFFDNGIFSGVIFVTVFLQAIMVEYGGKFIETEGLSGKEWGISILIGFCSLPLGFLGRLIPINPNSGRKGPPSDSFLTDLPALLAGPVDRRTQRLQRRPAQCAATTGDLAGVRGQRGKTSEKRAIYTKKD